MKRDWELVREILMKIESLGTIKDVVRPKDFENYDEETVSYHIYLLEQAGLIEAIVKKHHNTGIFALASNLTWSGHEFLDAIRDESVWNKIKSIAKEKGIDMPFEIVKATAIVLLKGLFA